MQRVVTALLLLAASPASGGALEEPWLGVYRDPDGLTIFMRQVVTKEPGIQGGRFARVGMAEAADADGASLGQRVLAALKAAAGGVRRAASPSAGDEEDSWRPGAAEGEEAAAPDPEEAERYKGLALDAEGRYQGLQ